MVDADGVGEVDRVLHDIDLFFQSRRDVYRGIGDDQRRGVAGHVHDETMADAACCAHAAVMSDHRGQQFVGVQAALHQRLGLALAYQRDDAAKAEVVAAVFRGNDRKFRYVNAVFLGDGRQPRRRPHQDRCDQVKASRLDRAGERHRVAGMRHSGGDRW